MGAPPNNDLDRELESPIDDAWSTDADEPVAAATDPDRTTLGTGEEAIAPVADDGGPRVVDHQAIGIGVPVDHDRTTIGAGEDRIELGVEASARAASEHDRTNDVVGANRVARKIAADSPAKATDHERTTVAVGVDRATRKIIDDLFADATDHDRTTVAVGANRVAREMADDAPAETDHDRTTFAVGADRVAREMVDDHDRTTFGMGVVTGARKSIALSAAVPELPEQKHDLVQPERSPLALVMGDMAANTGAPQAHATGDSSRFVAALVGDEVPAPEVAEAESPITAIPPKLMARRRRRWIAAGALATTVVVGTLFGMRFRGAAANLGDRQPVVAVPTPAPSPPATSPSPPTTPAPSAPAPPPPAIAQQPAPPASPQESEPPEAAPAARGDAAITNPNTRPATAKKTVATSNVPAKRPSSTRKTAKPAKPSTTAKKSTTVKKKRSFF